MPLPIDTCAANLDGMRGAGDPLTIGERIAFYRRRRGLSQATLAGMVGNGEDWLSKVERCKREIRRIDVLADLARELRVTLGDLLGQPKTGRSAVLCPCCRG